MKKVIKTKIFVFCMINLFAISIMSFTTISDQSVSKTNLGVSNICNVNSTDNKLVNQTKEGKFIKHALKIEAVKEMVVWCDGITVVVGGDANNKNDGNAKNVDFKKLD